MQISAMGEEFLATLDPDTWGPEIWMPSYICKQAEMTTYSATEVFEEIRQEGRADVLRRQQKR